MQGNVVGPNPTLAPPGHMASHGLEESGHNSIRDFRNKRCRPQQFGHDESQEQLLPDFHAARQKFHSRGKTANLAEANPQLRKLGTPVQGLDPEVFNTVVPARVLTVPHFSLASIRCGQTTAWHVKLR